MSLHHAVSALSLGLLSSLALAIEPARDRDEKAPKEIMVRHLGRDSLGKLVAESPHFRILHNEDPKKVEKLAREAEKVRPIIHRQWFGDVGIEWDGKCTIYLHPSRKKYIAKTGQWNALGHSRTLMVGNEVFGRSIHLPCDVPNLYEDVLPHEISHAVMAVRFRGRTPHWADEGMAMVAESEATRKQWLSRLPEIRQKDDLFSLPVLMRTQESAQINTVEFYTQSLSLVEFLASKKGRPVFTRFLWDSQVVGYEPALKKHYGFNSFADLERSWNDYAFPKVTPMPPGPKVNAKPAKD